ncbi:hypothetical protein [Caproiciproducens sp.]|uniref:hypothetical protein n=1 Tax=Caproiciproducens sp. TaxID=1954376 RepID=UPI00289FB644|nr:hypothetical protein [Caproiciproducens sp.]
MGELKPCRLCGKPAIIEKWSSGGLKYMAKCNNPNCPVPEDGYPSGHDLKEVFKQWNLRQEEK